MFQDALADGSRTVAPSGVELPRLPRVAVIVSAGLKERRSAGLDAGEVGRPLAGTRYALYTRF